MAKPRILYIEMLENNYGNKRLDIEIISSLSEFAEVTVSGPANWYPEFKGHVEFKETVIKSCPSFAANYIGRYWIPYQNMKAAARLYKYNKYDYIVFASYHPYVSALLPLYFNCLDRIYVMNHNNIDYLDTSARGRRLFSIFGRKINHIVFEDFISDYLTEVYKVENKKVHVIPHPMNTILDKYPVKYDCVGISNSNDEEWIEKLIEYENSTKMLLKKGLRVLIRSKSKTFDDGALTVITGYLQDDDYYGYICSSRYIFMAFPKTFKYRMSGTIVDALSNEIPVIGTDIPLIDSYSKKYKGIVFCAKEPRDLEGILTSSVDDVVDQFIRFKERHSHKSITESLKKMLGAD